MWGGAGVNAPGYTRALIFLTRGGGDASVVREFDMTTRQFVADGFNLPEAKSDIDFEDDDTVLVGTAFGEGSLTDSGYPRLIKRWRRGTPLEEAETIFSGSASDVAVSTSCISDPGFERTFIYRMFDFYNKETFELRDGELIRLDIPTDCSMAVHREWAMILLISDWSRGGTTYKADSVLIADYEQLVAGTAELRVVFDPDGDEFLAAGALSTLSAPFPMAKRRQLIVDLQTLVTTFDDHPWNWAAHVTVERTPVCRRPYRARAEASRSRRGRICVLGSRRPRSRRSRSCLILNMMRLSGR